VESHTRARSPGPGRRAHDMRVNGPPKSGSVSGTLRLLDPAPGEDK
jgi:hypothetical protein